ncbi:glycoside hydrolase family 6 protein [Phytoactinopolyspora halotolerans]|uniref:Glucanase n=1 Tax=Phytoactinopolyspora halotolerans TaxID=1981512 RepID=A0A6L9SK44_9ACTN|nr:glycoside hydrolase family 6 protein [Phytoactinopolyspora halotolerans]NEE04701.1 hypothetical protein [Phytoactinopolyspora halotolerans]
MRFDRHSGRHRLAGASALLAATGLMAGGLIATVATSAHAAVACEVDYSANTWTDGASSGGFTASVTINNLGDPVEGWALEFELPDGQSFTQGWSANWDADGTSITAENLAWNGTLGTGASTSVGFNGSWTGSYTDPSAFTLNGVACTGDPGNGGDNLPPTVSVTSPSHGAEYDEGATVPLAATASDPDGTIDRVEFLVDGDVVATDASAPYEATVSGLDTGSHTASAVAYDDGDPELSATDSASFTIGDDGEEPPPDSDNPYAGADVYVNPDWAGQVLDEASSTGGALGAAMEEVATYPTFVWMDRIGAITDGTGLVGHLDNAVAQDQANGATPTVFQVVIYNLPNRDCAASASNGELLISENGFQRYREEYIDPIAEILSRPEYSDLRIATVIEVDSLPNLVTNSDDPDCQEAAGDGGYRDGIRYALNELSAIPNVYNYLDIAHSGWLGWDSNFGPAVDLYVQTLTSSDFYGPAPGFDSVAGFVTNSANYTPIEEPYLPDPNLQPGGGGNPIRSSDFYEWNPYFDELDFTTDIREAFISRGMPDDIGMLIDTGRNGWGGPDRPSGVSDATDVNTYVDESRVDRRPHRGGWCNQAGAGIGERPTVSPGPGIDAYVWVKPPGESDGVSDPDFEPDPNDPNKKHDAMCNPEGQSTYDPDYPTNALPNAPHAGRWFPEQFAMLVENAYPAF